MPANGTQLRLLALAPSAQLPSALPTAALDRPPAQTLDGRLSTCARPRAHATCQWSATETTAGTKRSPSCLANPVRLLHEHIHSAVDPVHRNLRAALQAAARHGYSFLKFQSMKHPQICRRRTVGRHFHRHESKKQIITHLCTSQAKWRKEQMQQHEHYMQKT